MRITNSHRGHNTNFTKCTKMTEGEHRIHGMNGVTDSGSAAIKEECPQNSDAYDLGGRLKFFKNGKFILELARAREGEKVAWVPVPKKTFWPPQGSASSVTTYRQESSTSLSVSDDNSSVQSSPWQRDHTWKQTSPQRNASNHLGFYWHRSAPRASSHSCWKYQMQRSPYRERTKCSKKCNRCMNKSAISTRQSLIQIVQVLWNKSLQALNSITSPRKRILRELERVTIDDLSNKRCRGKVAANHCAVSVPPVSVSTSPKSTASGAATTDGVDVNGSADEHRVAASSKNCSYSITSLLGGKIDHRDDKLSSQFVPAPRITHHRIAAEESPTVYAHMHAHPHMQDTLDGPARPSPELMSGVSGQKRSALGMPEQYYGSSGPYLSPYAVYPAAAYVSPPYYSSATATAASATYARGGGAGYYAALAPPPPPPPQQSPYSWPLPTTSHPHTHTHTDDTISDVPLNLSKHAD